MPPSFVPGPTIWIILILCRLYICTYICWSVNSTSGSMWFTLWVHQTWKFTFFYIIKIWSIF